MRLPEERILILDGAMGTMIQRYGLTEEDYRSGVFHECVKELRGNNECLNLTHPEIIKSIHKEYIAAGADIIETNTSVLTGFHSRSTDVRILQRKWHIRARVLPVKQLMKLLL